jgi:hypothetical protein
VVGVKAGAGGADREEAPGSAARLAGNGSRDELSRR